MLESDKYGDWTGSKLTPIGKKKHVYGNSSSVVLSIVQDLGLLLHIYFCSPRRRCLEMFIET